MIRQRPSPDEAEKNKSYFDCLTASLPDPFLAFQAALPARFYPSRMNVTNPRFHLIHPHNFPSLFSNPNVIAFHQRYYTNNSFGLIRFQVLIVPDLVNYVYLPFVNLVPDEDSLWQHLVPPEYTRGWIPLKSLTKLLRTPSNTPYCAFYNATATLDSASHFNYCDFFDFKTIVPLLAVIPEFITIPSARAMFDEDRSSVGSNTVFGSFKLAHDTLMPIALPGLEVSEPPEFRSEQP